VGVSSTSGGGVGVSSAGGAGVSAAGGAGAAQAASTNEINTTTPTTLKIDSCFFISFLPSSISYTNDSYVLSMAGEAATIIARFLFYVKCRNLKKRPTPCSLDEARTLAEPNR
jgi:hypothetical protein